MNLFELSEAAIKSFSTTKTSLGSRACRRVSFQANGGVAQPTSVFNALISLSFRAVFLPNNPSASVDLLSFLGEFPVPDSELHSLLYVIPP